MRPLLWDDGTRWGDPNACWSDTGVDPDFVNVADSKDLEHTLKNLTPGTTIEAYVIPMNDGGAGAPSATLSKVVGA